METHLMCNCRYPLDACKAGLINVTETDALKAACAKYLPMYMRPSVWLCTDKLPVGATGKLDGKTFE